MKNLLALLTLVITLVTAGCAHQTPEQKLTAAKQNEEAKAHKRYLKSLPWWRREEERMRPSVEARMAAHQAAHSDGSMSVLPELPLAGGDTRGRTGTSFSNAPQY